MTAISLILDSTEGSLRRTVELTGWLKRRRLRFAWLKVALEAVDWLARGVFHVWRQRRYLTFYKLFNIGLVNLQFKLKTERVVGHPYRMKIESTNICNTKCQLCPTGIGLQGRPKGKMSLDEFKGLIKRVKRHLVSLDLSMWGDPLIVPDICEMIRYAHSKRIWTYISSNLHAYKPQRADCEALVRSGLDMLTCSLHGASQQTYEIYQPGKSFDEAVAKVRHIVATRDRLGAKTPVVQLNFVVTRHNEHEVDDFRQLAADLGCQAVFSPPSMNMRFVGRDKHLVDLGLGEDLKLRKRREHLKEWLPRNREYVLEPYQSILDGEYDGDQWNGSKIYNCDWPWRQSVINWDGQVVTCCGSFDPRYDMGNVNDTRFGKIWNGKKYRMARRSFKHRLRVDQATDNPCATCPGFML